MNYFFKCLDCGKYPVTPETFEKAVTPDVFEKVRVKIQDPSISIVVEFGHRCPKCTKSGQAPVTVKAVRATAN